MSIKTFIIIFLIAAFIFQFISNSLLGPEIRLFPANGEWFPGHESSIHWKHILATIIFPIKFILIEPLSFLGQDPDPVPPILFIAFATYWTLLALIVYFLLSLIFKTKIK